MGEYSYGETMIPDAFPAIITHELFERAQQRIEKNKRAPAKSKAKVDYLLTTKLSANTNKCEPNPMVYRRGSVRVCF